MPEPSWFVGFWRTMMCTIALLLTVMVLGIILVFVLPTDHPAVLIMPIYTIMALLLGFVLDWMRLQRRRRLRDDKERAVRLDDALGDLVEALDPGIYLALTYSLGPEAGERDYVGPFADIGAAVTHRDAFGPVEAALVLLSAHPSPCMSPTEHRVYTTDRL